MPFELLQNVKETASAYKKQASPDDFIVNSTTDPGANNQKFLVTLTSTSLLKDLKIDRIVGRLPEAISEHISSRWETPTDLLPSLGKLEMLAGAVGYSLKFAFMTRKIWAGSDALSVSVPFEFVAETDAVEDVVRPCRALQYVALPKKNKATGLLRPPGRPFISEDRGDPGDGYLKNSIDKGLKSVRQSIKGLDLSVPLPNGLKADYNGVKKAVLSDIDETLEGDQVNIRIGDFLVLTDCLVTDVRITWGTVMNAVGAPMRARCDVSVETRSAATKNRILNLSQFNSVPNKTSEVF